MLFLSFKMAAIFCEINGNDVAFAYDSTELSLTAQGGL
jgi:hypothetical protein